MKASPLGNNPQSYEEPVRCSRYMLISSVVVVGFLVGLYYIWCSREAAMWIFWVLIAVLLIPCLWLYPLRVGFRDGEFYIRRLFRTKVIPLSEIKDVRVFVPSPSDGRIMGIHGFFGRFGWYKSWEIGLYFAYIGDTDECFLVELKPDDRGKEKKYVVSCRNNIKMVAALTAALPNVPHLEKL